MKLVKIIEMNIIQTIKDADFESLRLREYMLLEHANQMIVNPSSDPEKFFTFWMAIHDNHNFGLTMFTIFKNTCETALGLSKWNDVMKVFAHPTMCGAVCSQNIDILEYVKSHVEPEIIWKEIESEFGVDDNEVYRWYQDNFS
jgi:hypothetical protein